MSLSPEQATIYSAVITTVGTLVGVFISIYAPEIKALFKKNLYNLRA